MNFRIFLLIFFGIWFFPFISPAHYIVGNVNDALDGTSANDHTVLLWNPLNGISDNLTDIIGVNGNSGVDNIYMIDCELLSTPCALGDVLAVKVIDNGDGYVSHNVSVTVTGAGYDTASNITLNSPPSFLSLSVDDSLNLPANEIDLVTGSTRNVICEGVVEELDGDSLQNISAEFFDETASFYGDSDDNNFHYSNTSCFINSGYGNENQTQIFCGFDVFYYANSDNWRCVLNLEDNLSANSSSFDSTFINSLLSIEVNSFVDFGILSSETVSDEVVLNISNLGNVKINLSLSGYAVTEGDGLAMNCSGGGFENISIDYQKYNLTDSTVGSLTLQEFETNYVNLTSSPATKKFNLNYRQNDSSNEAINATYWRIYVPQSIAGNCTGNIVIGAIVGGEV